MSAETPVFSGMLTELRIENFALIESLEVSFGTGLNVLTGETGAGKSILVDALSIVLGEKASAGVLRKGAAHGSLTAVFELGRSREIESCLEELSVEPEEGRVILRREIDGQGKSKSFLNDRPVSLSALSRLGSLLVEIHGQHEHQQLLQTGAQRDFLDRFAGNEGVRAEVERAWREWKDLLEARAASQMSESERRQKIDLFRFQVQEIDSAKLVPGEEEDLEKILPQLKNAEKIRAALDEAYERLYAGEAAALDQLKKSTGLLEKAQGLGAGFEEGGGLLEEARVRLEEAAAGIAGLRDQLPEDPQKLDAVLSRMDLLDKLKKKYGRSLEEILEYCARTGEELAKLENYTDSLSNLEEKIAESFQRMMKSARKLSGSRRKCAEELSKKIEKELRDLGFLKAQFFVELIPERDSEGREQPTAAGLERIEFLFSANPGEDKKPLKQVASGGELSRVMLALKKTLAQQDRVPVLVFDEVDAGVGGTTGRVLGEKLKSLGETHQILAVTHLPQVAAFADRHLAVRKNVVDRRTLTDAELLIQESRVREIARMLGGVAAGRKDPSPASLKHAEELIQNAAS